MKKETLSVYTQGKETLAHWPSGEERSYWTFRAVMKLLKQVDCIQEECK